MGNTQASNFEGQENQYQLDKTKYFDFLPYIKQLFFINNCKREGITPQDVLQIRQAFENLRDENDAQNEIKLSKLKRFPLFTKNDMNRIMLALNSVKEEHQSDFSKRDSYKNLNYEIEQYGDNYQQYQKYYQQQPGGSQFQRGNVKVENRGIDCYSIMCSCNSNPKMQGIREPTITFDQFFEVMLEKINEQRQSSNIVFESKQQNVSCFLWPLLGSTSS